MHSGEEDEDDDISEDLDAAMRSLQALTSKVSGLVKLTPHIYDSSAAVAPAHSVDLVSWCSCRAARAVAPQQQQQPQQH
jgi:hypothetical protein